MGGSADGPKRRRTLLFWEPTVSPHKLALVRALAGRPDVASVRYVAETDMPDARARQGWQVDVGDDLDVVISPSPAQIRAVFDAAPADAIHLVSGLRRVPTIIAALDEIARRRARFGILSEPRRREGVAGLARWAQSWLTERRLRRDAAFVLAIGRNGPPWFRSTGYPAARIFPFAYFLPEVTRQPRAESVPVRVGYLGRLTHGKGIDLFLDAVSRLPSRFGAVAAGAGDAENLVARAAASSGGLLTALGAIPMMEVAQYLGTLDILVCPSRNTDDGWGAAVSEGLMAGVPIVATDRVGASICLDAPWRGEVVRRLSGRALALAIERAATPDMLSEGARKRRAAWGCARLGADGGAQYLLGILAHTFDGAPRPAAFYADE